MIDLRRKLRQRRRLLLRRWHAWRALSKLNSPRNGRAHGLPGELIISLTSYPARFHGLHFTLACLLHQAVRPDRLILWIAHDDLEQLPPTVRAFEERGVEIRACDDLRSFKKLVPTLQAFPDAFIVTADDDICYPPDWLEKLVNATEQRVITGHRAHRMKRSVDGSLRPYVEWEFNVQDAKARQPSADILPTGAGGILYPPRSLDPRATDRSLFERLCPDCDDLWFYWCARLAGTIHKKVPGTFRLLHWPGSQRSSLWKKNQHGGNDAAIAALEQEFGYPPMRGRMVTFPTPTRNPLAPPAARSRFRGSGASRSAWRRRGGE
jgi:hypothetical protein